MFPGNQVYHRVHSLVLMCVSLVVGSYERTKENNKLRLQQYYCTYNIYVIELVW